MEFRKELLQAVALLEIRARRDVTSLLSGDYRSAFRGSGMQFKEFRQYEEGDDIRHMAWTVTARTGHATVKVYEEERELDVMLMVDVSGSSLFGMGKKRKLDMYAELIALIGLAAVKSGDKVGIMLFNDSATFYLPPKRTRSQVLVALTHLLSQPMQKQKSDLRPALRYARNVLRNRSIIVIISDFLLPSFDDEFRVLTQRNEVVLLHCYDDAERGMGLEGVYEICDPETGEFLLLDGNSRHLKQQLTKEHMDLSDRLESLSKGMNADYLCLSVEDDYLQRLVHFFRQRGPARL